MYIECKSGGLYGWGRIGRVGFSKTGKTLYCKGKSFQRWQGSKSNYYDIESGESYWINGPKKAGGDRLNGAPGVEIDEDVRQEYWTAIRGEPKSISRSTS